MIRQFEIQQWTVALLSRPEPGFQDADFLAWIDRDLRAFFPFRRFLACYGSLVSGRIEVHHRLSIGAAVGTLERIPLELDLRLSGCIKHWVETRRPLLIDFFDPPAFVADWERDLFARAGRVAAHGVIDLAANAGSYFAFGGLEAPLGTEHAQVLDLVVPTLHAMLVDLVQQNMVSHDHLDGLTAQQRKVVNLVAAGASNKMVARSLGIAEKTVRNMLTSIYVGLGVSGRYSMMALLRSGRVRHIRSKK